MCAIFFEKIYFFNVIYYIIDIINILEIRIIIYIVRVKFKLQNCARAVMLDRFIPTTQTCVCGVKNKHNLSDRVYKCDCGYENDRDVHSAQMMILFGESIGTEHTDFKSVEMKTSAVSNNSKLSSKNQKASKSLTLT